MQQVLIISLSRGVTSGLQALVEMAASLIWLDIFEDTGVGVSGLAY